MIFVHGHRVICSCHSTKSHKKIQYSEMPLNMCYGILIEIISSNLL